MDKRLYDVLNGKESNYLLPFYWLRDNQTALIPEQIQRIYDSGCRALCVEARPHSGFVEETWWRDMDVILSEAQKRDMKVWLFDDDKYPSGHAAGMTVKKYPELRQWELIERHIDVVGPAPDTSVLVKPDDAENILIGAYAYKRRADELETCCYDAVNLTDHISNGYLLWDIPDGVWRIFFYYQSRRGGRAEYIDMFNPDSVRILINTVYESHFAHYGQYFGNTFAGFFCDEPCFGNEVFGQQRFSYGFYEARIGNPGLALPWNETIWNGAKEKLGYDPIPHLNLLWYEDGENGDLQASIRHAYMDTITHLFSEYHTKQLADWCHAHSVQFIGHVIEDMNCHMSAGVGHYFRALCWQDMSGIDVVLHQIMPGMSDYIHSSMCATGACTTFFDYVLAKLGASLAHLTPAMKGRALCETFGAYGWGEDSTMMKYLIDHLLVRGINHFVPHAFCPEFPVDIYPPHFGAEGHDPSFEAFGFLMQYANKAAHLLEGATHIANAAILYHVDGEWASRFGNASNMDSVAAQLYDHHIDYDIVSMDMLRDSATVNQNQLRIHNERFDCLIVPYADHMPEILLEILERLQKDGLPVWFMKEMPENAGFEGTVLQEKEVAARMQELGMTDVTIEGEYPKLRIYHCRRDDNDILMFVNEDYSKAVDTTVNLPCVGDYARLDLLAELYTSGHLTDHKLDLKLLPNQSQIVIFGDKAGLPAEQKVTETIMLTPDFELELAESDDLTLYQSCGVFDHFFNINHPGFQPDFSGKMRYRFAFDALKKEGKCYLDLGRVGQNAELFINGIHCGIRINAPYLFDITDAMVDGANQAVVIVSNTLAQKVKDRWSYHLQLAPSGLLGDLCIKYME